jgi:hypothetical protein
LSATLVALAVGGAEGTQKTTDMGTGGGGSPHLRAEWTIDGANLSIEYGRPYLKKRSESQMMPPGRVWRTGADEQTTLKTDKALKFGTLAVPAGTYGLYTIPGAKEWQLVVSRRPRGSGAEYPDGQDLGRVPMKVGQASKPVEQLTISIDDTPQGASLRIEWGTTSVSVPFTLG